MRRSISATQASYGLLVGRIEVALARNAMPIEGSTSSAFRIADVLACPTRPDGLSVRPRALTARISSVHAPVGGAEASQATISDNGLALTAPADVLAATCDVLVSVRGNRQACYGLCRS